MQGLDVRRRNSIRDDEQGTHVHVLLGHVDDDDRLCASRRLVCVCLEPSLAHDAVVLVLDVDEGDDVDWRREEKIRESAVLLSRDALARSL